MSDSPDDPDSDGLSSPRLPAAMLRGMVLLLGLMPLSSRARTSLDLPLPPGWDVEQRDLNLYEDPAPAERELRVTKGFPTSVELLDGRVDLVSTTMKGARGRIELSAKDGELLVGMIDHLEPGERVPLSVAYLDGGRVELTLVKAGLVTDVWLRVRRSPEQPL
ncbi:DUF2381 family protein [Melittangium boletus]|uniref:Uncharacterized protein n=1 Tax=Melittangium boletus DSM 14713 TaxID=1294270 RepID=A0A250IHV5_9BACT|nr:DUF2381 family protein [Melittangium boletus]ATB31404.1 hypothetical protein MEBOL_004867 [Melittangium boletus DSM 14713]